MKVGKHAILPIALVFAIWRLSQFLVSVFADKFLKYLPSFPYAFSLLPSYNAPRWLYSFANFDGVHYLTIAKEGYLHTNYIQAFFPLYPAILMRFLHSFGLNELYLGLVISNLSFFLLLVTWKHLITRLYGSRAAWFSMFALILFPTSFFFGALYTESFFLLLCLLAFLFAEQKRWLLAGIVCALASATRVVGIFLVPALLFELWRSYDRGESENFSWKNAFFVLCGSLGLLGYMLFLQQNFHDPLYFFHIQSAFGAGRQSDKLIFYPQVVYRGIKILLTARPFDLKYFAYLQEFLAGTLGLVGLILAARKVRLSFSIFAISSFILPTFTGSFSSIPRYLLLCFPLFIWLGMVLSKHPKLSILWYSVSGMFLILNLVLFLQGYWVA